MNVTPMLALALALCSLPPPPTATQQPPGCIPVVITQPLQGIQLCLGDTGTLHVGATGSNLQYSWTHGGLAVAGQTTDTVVLSSVTMADRGIWCVTVSNECSTAQSCCRVSISDCGGSYCTLTQGAYGNPNGQWNGMNRVQLITSLLASSPLVIGKPGRSLTIPSGAASAQCIIDRLPAGGRAAALPAFGDQVLDSSACNSNPPMPTRSGRYRNVLVGQTIALALNLRLDSTLGPLVLCTQMTTTNGTFAIDPTVIDAMVTYGGGHGATNLLNLANYALSGGNTGSVSLPLICSAVDALNQAFDECATLTGCQ
jgi:hypothetical protein